MPTHPLTDYDGHHAPGVLVGTFNRAKGLEFKEVYIHGIAGDEWPSRSALPPGLDEEQRTERMAQQLRTLFVGMSRARDRLELISRLPLHPRIEGARGEMDVVEY